MVKIQYDIKGDTVYIKKTMVALPKYNKVDYSTRHITEQKGSYTVSARKFRQDKLDSDSSYFHNEAELTLDNKSFETFIRELNETFKNKTFVITGQEIMKKKIISDIKGADLKKILDEVSIQLNLQYHIDSDTVYIQEKNSENNNRTHTDRMD